MFGELVKDPPKPIFFGVTRSFFFAVSAGALILGQGEEVVVMVAEVIYAILTWMDYLAWKIGAEFPIAEVENISGVLRKLAPVLAVIAILYERRGNNRPYTINPKAVK